MARPTVPKFGNWEKEHVQYTVFFENARAKKGAGGTMINPNDPEENPSAFGGPPERQEQQPQERANRQFHRENRQGGEEDRDRDFFMNSPYRAFDNQREDTDAEKPKGNGSSSSAQNNPLRPKFAQVEPQQHQRVVSVPKFGDWNGGNGDAGGYTVIFNQVKEDKQNAAINPPIAPYTPPRYLPDQQKKAQKPSQPTFFCCFCPKAAD